MAESTSRLLDDHPELDVPNLASSSHADWNNGLRKMPESDKFYSKIPTFLNGLRTMAFVASALALGFIIPSYILIKSAPSGGGAGKWIHWNAGEQTKRLGRYIIASFLLSIIDFAISLPTIIGIVTDIIISLGVASRLGIYFKAIPRLPEWCEMYRYPPSIEKPSLFAPEYPPGFPVPISPDCELNAKVIEILMIATGILGVILVAARTFKLVTLVIKTLRLRPWSKSTWNIRVGTYTLCISLNINEKECERGSTPGHRQ